MQMNKTNKQDKTKLGHNAMRDHFNTNQPNFLKNKTNSIETNKMKLAPSMRETISMPTKIYTLGPIKCK